MIADALAVAGAVIWILVIVLPWRAWSTRERMDEAQAGEAALLDDVTVLIPARNEAPMLGETLPAVAAQGQCLRIIVIDDASSDATADVAIGCGIRGLRVIERARCREAGQASCGRWSRDAPWPIAPSWCCWTRISHSHQVSCDACGKGCCMSIWDLPH